jgi:hypothetical protein
MYMGHPYHISIWKGRGKRRSPNVRILVFFEESAPVSKEVFDELIKWEKLREIIR